MPVVMRRAFPLVGFLFIRRVVGVDVFGSVTAVLVFVTFTRVARSSAWHLPLQGTHQVKQQGRASSKRCQSAAGLKYPNDEVQEGDSPIAAAARHPPTLSVEWPHRTTATGLKGKFQALLRPLNGPAPMYSRINATFSDQTAIKAPRWFGYGRAKRSRTQQRQVGSKVMRLELRMAGSESATNARPSPVAVGHEQTQKRLSSLRIARPAIWPVRG